MKLRKNGKLRIAIYTRKSTDAGPDKEANSLVVQREAVERHIKSLNRKDMIILEERFDDNNVSGGTMDRPAMNRLIQLIEDGEIEAIAIHRLDRISRSLLQFLELLGFFEQHNISFICVTHNFDTSTIFGRMIVSILMMFAELERETIRERVTDRIHAARRKGRFTGGQPPLGYTIVPKGRALAVDEVEAVMVRAIFELYLELRSVKAVTEELKRRGWNNKRWVTREGKITGGKPFTPSTLHYLLTNPVLIGKVKLKSNVYEGQQDGIVDPTVFDQVQELLKKNCLHKGNRKRNTHNALLKGLLICKHCNTPYTHTQTKKGNNKAYRYYTCSNKRINGAHTCPSSPLSAGEIESLVVDQLMSIGTDTELQDLVCRQLSEDIARKKLEDTKARATAERQMDKLSKELAASREYGASEPVISLLEEKYREAEDILAKTKSAANWPSPTKQDVVIAMRNLSGLWHAFNEGEKCGFVRTLVHKVVYDAAEGNLTFHFNDEGFATGTIGGNA